MSDKIKKAARARQKLTNEPYMASRRHVIQTHGGGGSRRPEPRDPGEVTVVASARVVVNRINATNAVRFEVVPTGLVLYLDDRLLGQVPARVMDGRAYVSDGEFDLSDGWGVRFEGEYEEPDAEIGIDGGWRTGGSAHLLQPPGEGLTGYDGRRFALLSVEFRKDGGVCGSGGTADPVCRSTFIAPALPPVVVELGTLPKPGEESQNVVDYHRRPVLKVERGLREDGSTVLVVLGEPMRPEGAWSLAEPNFPRRGPRRAPPPRPPYPVGTQLVFAGRRCMVTHDDGRYAALYFGVSAVVPEVARVAVAREAEEHFVALGAWKGGDPEGINLVVERRPTDPEAYVERVGHLPAGHPERVAFLSRVSDWLARHDRSSGFGLGDSRVPEAIRAVASGKD